jgi:hypothetical protein
MAAIAGDLYIIAARRLAIIAAVFFALGNAAVAGLMGTLTGLFVCHHSPL